MQVVFDHSFSRLQDLPGNFEPELYGQEETSHIYQAKRSTGCHLTKGCAPVFAVWASDLVPDLTKVARERRVDNSELHPILERTI
jgi:hypothetical protein